MIRFLEKGKMSLFELFYIKSSMRGGAPQPPKRSRAD